MRLYRSCRVAHNLVRAGRGFKRGIKGERHSPGDKLHNSSIPKSLGKLTRYRFAAPPDGLGASASGRAYHLN